MKSGISRKKKVVFSLIICIVVFVVLNVIAWFISPGDTAFWQNPLMVMYPVEHFDPAVTIQQYNFNKDPNRSVRYVPDKNRWYRLDPEPLIPSEGKLILNFGDSSTWGWGLTDRGNAYPMVLDKQLPPGIHSINLGIPGYSSLQGRRYLEELLPKYHNQIVAVTLYFGNNDSTENGSSDSDKLRGERLGRKILRSLPLLRIVHDGWARNSQRQNKLPRVSPEDYEENLRAMIGLSKSWGVKVIVIEPPRHLSWRPANLNHTQSLESNVVNPWVKQELVLAQALYTDGLDQIYRSLDGFAQSLTAALDHDWVVPRIKSDWLARLRGVVGVADSYLALPEPWIEAETYIFEDYCHPTARAHEQIAQEMGLALGFK